MFKNSVESKILKLIKKSKNILLHLHVKPDPDSLGSVLSMYWFLIRLNKNVTIIKGDSNLTEELSFLPGFENITHKNFFEIDLNSFDLFIILDSASKEMISQIGPVIFPAHLKTINIDHHKTNQNFAGINFIDSKSSATCELLFNLFKKWKFKIDQKIAQNLLAGIFSDTGGFRYDSVTPKTFKIIFEITKIYPDFHKLIQNLTRNYRKDQILFQALALNNFEVLFDDRVVISTVTFDMLQKNKINNDFFYSGDVPNFFISVKNWDLAAIITEKEKEKVFISLRSKNGIDVSKIAFDLGGGGHFSAAGIALKISPEQAKQKLILEIEKYLKNEFNFRN